MTRWAIIEIMADGTRSEVCEKRLRRIAEAQAERLRDAIERARPGSALVVERREYKTTTVGNQYGRARRERIA